MPPKCKICNHKKRAEIEEKILNGISARKIAACYDFSIASVSRHRNNCMPRAVSVAAQKGNITKTEKKIAQKRKQLAPPKDLDDIESDTKTELAGVTLLDKMKKLEDETQDILVKAKKAKSYNVALMAIDKLTKLHELSLKFAAEAREQEKARNEKIKTDQDIVIEIVIEIFEEFPEVMERFQNECVRRKIITG